MKNDMEGGEAETRKEKNKHICVKTLQKEKGVGTDVGKKEVSG